MIDIVIVNWNSGTQLSECVRAVGSHNQGLVQSIIIVDNNSSDGSLDHLEENLIPVHIIRNSENRGFGVACNQGAALATSEFILFLNPDTVIFERSLQVPYDFMVVEKNQDVGICGIQMIDEAGGVLRHCARFPTPLSYLVHAFGLSSTRLFAPLGIHMREWDHLSTRSVQHVIGAFFFVRRSLFEELKGFDPRFFVYLEDVDFSYQAHLKGWRTVYLADAKIFHACGGTSRQIKARRLFYSLRSRLIYGQKHFSYPGIAMLYLVTLGIEPLTRLIQALASGKFQNIRNVLRAYGMLLSSLPQILKTHHRLKTSAASPSEMAPK
ncbi:MAG: glycosyltransferase family 2 protein [Marinosulfonomonas sp.]|nr:glycosyltransferase family 2 protein [Marinosulfonomonas sp.]